MLCYQDKDGDFSVSQGSYTFLFHSTLLLAPPFPAIPRPAMYHTALPRPTPHRHAPGYRRIYRLERELYDHVRSKFCDPDSVKKQEKYT